MNLALFGGPQGDMVAIQWPRPRERRPRRDPDDVAAHRWAGAAPGAAVPVVLPRRVRAVGADREAVPDLDRLHGGIGRDHGGRLRRGRARPGAAVRRAGRPMEPPRRPRPGGDGGDHQRSSSAASARTSPPT